MYRALFKFGIVIILLCGLFFAGYYTVTSFSKYHAQNESYVISNVSGDVKIKHEGVEVATPAEKYQTVSPKDVIQTEGSSDVEVVLKKGNAVKLKENSALRVDEADKRTKAPVTALLKGKVLAKVAKASANVMPGDSVFTVQTPNAVAGVRGTEFIVVISEGGGFGFGFNTSKTMVLVSRGTVNVKATSSAVDADVTAGHKAHISRMSMRPEILALTDDDKAELKEIEQLKTELALLDIIYGSMQAGIYSGMCGLVSNITKSEMSSIEQAVLQYYLKYGDMPGSLDKIDMIWKRNGYEDSCGMPYLLRKTSRTTVELRSAGSDRLYNTSDDIVSKIVAPW
jgi:hypothetical protein